MDPLQMSQFGSGLGGFLGGMFGNSGEPYEAASGELKNYLNKAAGYQNPFFNAGAGAIPDYQKWLQGMSNPSGFINGLMGQYQESPWAKYQQQQSMRAGTNAASASGLTGSTPFAQQLQQNAQNISSQDMNQWLQNVLGINTQYGQGVGNLMTGGQNAANAMTNLFGDYGKSIAEQKYNQKTAENNDWWNMIGGGLSLAAMFL